MNDLNFNVKDVMKDKRICLSCRRDFDARSQLFTIFVSKSISQYEEIMFQWNVTLPHITVPVDICFNCLYAGLEAQQTQRRMNG